MRDRWKFRECAPTEQSERSSQKKDVLNFEEVVGSLTTGDSASVFHQRREVSKGSRRTADHTSSIAAAAHTIRFVKWADLHGVCHDKIATHHYQGPESSPRPSRCTVLPRVSTMEA